ncbi:MAG: asparagine synthase-related protein, partial [Chitinophagaceae bacterium]
MIRGFFGCIKKNVDRLVVGDWGSFYFDDEQEVQLVRRSTEAQNDLMHINGTIRLDYRDELGDKLGIRYADLFAMSDDELVKQAYHKWGADLVFHLEGDWSIAVFDSEKQQLLLAKEPSGISAIFYLEHEGAIYFASDTRVLSRLTNRDRIVNESYLKSLEEPLHGFQPHQTADRDIRYLMCGERMLFDQAEMRCEAYTNLLSQPAKLSYRYAVDQVLQFRSVFAESVRQKVDFNKKTGIFLSGGLDSGSVGALLAMELQCKQQQFDAYTSVPAFSDELSESVRTIADESPVVQHLVNAYGSIIPHAVDFKGDAVISNHIEKRIEDCFYPVITKNTYWINGILKQAYEAGVSRMMQAQTGNYIISWNA